MVEEAVVEVSFKLCHLVCYNVYAEMSTQANIAAAEVDEEAMDMQEEVHMEEERVRETGRSRRRKTSSIWENTWIRRSV